MSNSSHPFDAYYYAHGCGTAYGEGDEWAHLFDVIGARIVRGIAPKTVLDAGCAMGLLVDSLRQKGVAADGIDISEHAIQRAPPAAAEFCHVGSITEPLPSPFAKCYDLIVSIEVLEHMDKSSAEAAIAHLCTYSDDILFSSSPDDYKEVTHINVQPPAYWALQFGHHGFYRDIDFDASFISPWAVRFRRRSEPAAVLTQSIVRDYERRHWLLWKENQELRQLALEQRETLAKQSDHNTGEMAKQVQQLASERDSLRDLVQRYEQGKFMRLMRWLRGMALFGHSIR